MDRKTFCFVLLGLVVAVTTAGCQSPYHTDRGALFGGLLGAGTGAIIGDAVGNAGAGTAIGAGVGALTGAALGSGLDEIEAKNRAMISQQLGRQVAAEAVTLDDVVAMTKAGVDDELIVNHIGVHGAAATLRPADLIFLQQQGVSTRVIKALQTPPQRPAQPAVASLPPSTPVIVEEHHYGPPVWGPHYYPRHHRWHRHARPGVSWGVSLSN